METLQFKIGFGGVMKAEFRHSDELWTVLMCNDGTVTVYSIKNGNKDFFQEDLTPAEADQMIKKIRSSKSDS